MGVGSPAYKLMVAWLFAALADKRNGVYHEDKPMPNHGVFEEKFYFALMDAGRCSNGFPQW